jgi:sirohydrochlorin ferrochelatase/(2Fe-2S) ferredoxin
MSSLPTRATSVVIVGHGSRDDEASAQFEAFVEGYRAHRPDLVVRHGYIELAQPNIADVLAQAAAQSSRVVVVPLSLLTAGHVKNELPLLVTATAERFPHCRLHTTPALGVNPGVIAAVVAEARDFVQVPATAGSKPDATEGTMVVVVGRGSSDPDANGDFCKLARLIGEGLDSRRVLPCFIGITEPRVEETLELAARSRPARLLIVPYFLFTGVLVRRLEGIVKSFAARHPWIKTRTLTRLAADAELYAVVDERVDAAFRGGDPLPCMTCQYRAPLGRIAGKVGGLDALLWSVRHSLTHSQAAPHAHAHKPLAKHVLVCTNSECAGRGSIQILQRLRRLLRDRGAQQTIRVTRTSCMGRCGEGPTVAVYPDGIWYRGFEAADADELVTEHLLGGRLLGRRVDSIM